MADWLLTETERDAWERQPHETARAFEAFAVYRDLGPQRGIRKVGKVLSKNMTTIGGWSSKYHWVDRAAAWDSHQDKQRRDAATAAIQEMNDRHIQLAALLQSKAVEKIQRLAGESVAQLNPRDVASWLDLAVKVERIARGAPTEVVETRGEDGEGPGRIARSILESESAMQKALDLLDEVAADEASKRSRPSPAADL